MTELADRYLLQEPVGEGGMARVWRAHDRVLDRTVAVKVLLGRRPDAPASMRAEAAVAAGLSHPHIAEVYDYGETRHDGRLLPFMVLEFIDGPTLARHLDGTGPMRWPEASRICADVAAAVAHAHSEGLVHRDLKPGNVMLSPRGAKVVDFGLAVPVGCRTTDETGRIWGTPAYLAPEYLDGGPARPEGDVYALGLLLYACLTGRPAWAATSCAGVLRRRRSEAAPTLAQLSDLPAGIDNLYRRCLSDRPAQRPTAAEVAETLRQVSRSGAALSRRSIPPASPTREFRLPRQSRVNGRSAVFRPGPTRRVGALLGVTVAAAAGVAVAQAIESPPVGVDASARGPAEISSSSPGPGSCAAQYTSVRNPDGTFTAELAITNLGKRMLRGWSVAFDIPDGHRITGADGDISQDGTAVLMRPLDHLAPGSDSTLSLRGRFQKAEQRVPGGFSVNGVECERVSAEVVYGPPSLQAASPRSPAVRLRDTPKPRNTTSEQECCPSAGPRPSTSPSRATSAAPEPSASTQPTTTPSAEPTTSPSPSRSASSSPTPSDSATASVSPSATASTTPSATASTSPRATIAPSNGAPTGSGPAISSGAPSSAAVPPATAD